jgi:hypothetical protein
MKFAHRGVVGGLAGAVIAAVLGSFLAVNAPADPPILTLVASDAGVGQAIHATAQLSESPGAEGEISFEVFGPGDPSCAGTPLTPTPAAATVNGEGPYDSGDFTPAGAGTYSWSAHYTGDLINPSADAACAPLSTVSKAAPTLSGSASAATVGGAIHDEVSLSGGFSPSGNVTFSVYAPGDTSCTTVLGSSTVEIQSGQAISGDLATSEAGEFRWTASYPGDANNEAVALACNAANQTSTVNKASPTLSGVATPAVDVGQTITDSATLAGGFTPGDDLVFRTYAPGDSSCAGPAEYEAPVPVSGNGTYAPPGFAPASPGLYRWTVESQGDANNEAVSTACNDANQGSTVSKASPTLTGVASAAIVGGAIHDEVSLSGGFSPSGNVTFSVYAPGDISCTTVLNTSTVPIQSAHATSAGVTISEAGEFHWKASYPGDSNNEAANLPCNAANQTSTVSKASPTLSGIATSVPKTGLTITDNATLAGGFSAGGNLIFRTYGPGDSTCATSPKYSATVAVNDDGSYSPPGFSPPAGLYRWTVEYEGDPNNNPVSTICNDANQGSAVGTIAVTLTTSASGGTVGNPVTATATIQEGAIPAGQLTFKAFPPNDANCSGTAAFSSTVSVAGNGSYRSAAFVPSRVGSFRWTVAYSGDVNHNPATVTCGKTISSIVQAKPTIAGAVKQQITVGTSFRDTATLQGGYAPGGTVTFRVYGPVASGCGQPLFVDTVAVSANGTVSSDPFSAQRPGRYSFVASYSGDVANQATTEPCDSAAQVTQVRKRTPQLKPRAVLIGRKTISIRAKLSGGASPSGSISFRLYRPGDKHCRRRPAFSGAISIKSNGSYSLAQYLATKSGLYRLSVSYSGDQRNQRYKGNCGGAQPIRVG